MAAATDVATAIDESIRSWLITKVNPGVGILILPAGI
jgi:hypothetical protein